MPCPSSLGHLQPHVQLRGTVSGSASSFPSLDQNANSKPRMVGELSINQQCLGRWGTTQARGGINYRPPDYIALVIGFELPAGSSAQKHSKS